MALRDAVLEEVEDLLEDKAQFCLVTGVQPSEYDQLTDDERAAFVRVYNRLVPDSDDAESLEEEWVVEVYTSAPAVDPDQDED